MIDSVCPFAAPSLIDYKSSVFPDSVFPDHDFLPNLDSYFSLPTFANDDQFLDLFTNLSVCTESHDSSAISDCFLEIRARLLDFARSGRSFPLSADSISALLAACTAVRDSNESDVVISHVLDIFLFALRTFSSAAACFRSEDLIEFIGSVVRGRAWFLSHIEATFEILRLLARDCDDFLETLGKEDAPLVGMVIEAVFGYREVRFPNCFPEGEANVWRQEKDGLMIGLPMVVELLTIPTAPETLKKYFRRLQEIGAEQFVFDPEKQPPEGMAVPIIVAIVQCFAKIGEQLSPEDFMELIRAPDGRANKYYEVFFDWAQYVKGPAIETPENRGFLDEIVCSLVPIFLKCIEIDPPIFLDFQAEGLFDLLSMPLVAYEWLGDFDDFFRTPNLWQRTYPSFVVTQEHFDRILDLIVTILCKIAAGDITERSPNYFQSIIFEGLKHHLRAPSETKARILTAFAAIAVHSDDAVKQRIIIDLGCLSGMADLLDEAPPEMAALLVKALVVLLNHALPLGEQSGIAEVIQFIDPDQIEHCLPDHALPDLEQLRAFIRTATSA
jgi:hypothetical protein